MTQRLTQVVETIDLPCSVLARMIAHRGEIVPEDRRGTSSDGTCRALGVVELVSGHTVFGGDFRSYHLQQVELGCHLEQCPGVFWGRMKLSNIAPNLNDCVRNPAGKVFTGAFP